MEKKPDQSYYGTNLWANVDQNKCKEIIRKVKIVFSDNNSKNSIKEFLAWPYRDTNLVEIHLNVILPIQENIRLLDARHIITYGEMMAKWLT